MMKRTLSLVLAIAALSLGSLLPVSAEETTQHWEGTVTAVNSNGNRPGRSFTAVDAEGQVKIFYISSLKYLNVGDRVSLSYITSKTFPYTVTRIKFSLPEQQAQ
jgi:hypothetical protein